MKIRALILSLYVSTTTLASPIKVSDAEAVFLFRYVGAVVPLTENATQQILHVDLMMCSMLLNLPSKKMARCLLPTEQVRIEQDNAVEITTILQNNNMPKNFQFGYETREAGLDCTNALSGDQYPVCFLTAQTSR